VARVDKEVLKKKERRSPMLHTVKNFKAKNVHRGHGRRVYVKDRRIAIFNDAGVLRAVDDTCTHVGGSLSEGSCEGGVVTCPWHGAQFRLRDGQCLGDSPYRRLKVYPARVNDGLIELEIDWINSS